MGASLLRLHFHDCFVEGCDASLLLDVPGGEKESVHNANSLRGFEVIDFIKQQVEGSCPGVVSCADILALAARDSVVALGGPSWRVEFGRTDSTSRPSAQSADRNIPFATDDLSTISSLFASKGFSVREMVALSGAHTIGQARCVRFRDRAYGEQNIEPSFAQRLQNICPASPNIGDDNLAPLDSQSPITFNNDYFRDLTNFMGLLHSDQVLFSRTARPNDVFVQAYANAQPIFFKDFASAMLKMSRMGGAGNGLVRTNCRVVG
ncbi:cationic peroxidase 1-like [Amaranthus tricolor]|uniref:cationic peroxidase 1-like n=1 Tax=Amaranthus tricolor TaxID=29722 RepID=UPI00258D1CFE|nr:cationic peroxidase 1-like [Amaranthus tricolor]